MTLITLTSDQLAAWAAATDDVVLVDQSGNVIAKIPPYLCADEAALVDKALRALESDQPRIPSSEVLKRLAQLDGTVATPTRDSG